MKNITIALPVYQSEKWIRQAMDSIFNQTSKNFDLIIVHDGSTDNTLNILKEYKKKHNFTLIHQDERLGQDKAFNLSHQMVKTKYIAFFMGDDELLPNYIEEVDKCINETGADFIRGYWLKNYIIRNPELDDNACPCRIYTKKLWEEVGGYHPEWDFYNDIDFWYKIKHHKPMYKIALIRTPIYRYYMRQGNISTSPERHTQKWVEAQEFEMKWKNIESRYIENGDVSHHTSLDGYIYTWLADINVDDENYVDYKLKHKQRLELLDELVKNKKDKIAVVVSHPAYPNMSGELKKSFKKRFKDVEIKEYYSRLTNYTIHSEVNVKYKSMDDIYIKNNMMFFRLVAIKNET